LYLTVRLTKRLHEYEHEIESLKKRLDDRKIIEKAKGILMNKFNLTEDAAYKQMRSKAMNSAKPLVEVAKNIVDVFKSFR
jgi:response regulator NasT